MLFSSLFIQYYNPVLDVILMDAIVSHVILKQNRPGKHL